MEKILSREDRVRDNQVLGALDWDYPGLEKVKEAMESGNYDQAKNRLVLYMSRRRNVKFLFDYRGKPLIPVPEEASPFFFQSSVGLQGNVREFCLLAGKRMLEGIYTVPGERQETLFLGDDFQNAPHFNTYRDMEKKSRHTSNLFTRGQWMEYLFFYYQETGDKQAAVCLEKCLQCFWRDYPLKIENTVTNTLYFQYTEDRTVMSVGWLLFSYIELLYTQLAYEMEADTAFGIIKRIWYLGLQFTRFTDDSFEKYNHHLWERGIVPFILGILFPEFKSFKGMRERGAEIIREHILRDFDSEGGYHEHSIGYWAGATMGEMLSKAVILAKENGIALLDKECENRLQKSMSLLALLAPPGSSYPNVGDGKGTEVSHILRLCGELLGNRECRELQKFREKQGKEQPALPLYCGDDETGYCCVRTGYGEKDTYLLMSVKRESEHSGHGHMDMLSLFLTVRGQEIIGEPYAGSLYHKGVMGSSQRGYLYNMSSHNLVLAYGRPIQEDSMYSSYWECFCPECRIEEWRQTERGLHITAAHKGYTFCRITREVDFSEKGEVRIRDEVSSGRRLEIPHIQRWHLMPGVRCKRLSDTSLLLEKDGVKVLMRWKGAMELKLWKNEAMLCPDIVLSEEELGWIVDAFFQNTTAGEGDCAWIETEFLDVTGERENH